MGYRHYFWWTTFDVMANAGIPKGVVYPLVIGSDWKCYVSFLFHVFSYNDNMQAQGYIMSAPFCARHLSQLINVSCVCQNSHYGRNHGKAGSHHLVNMHNKYPDTPNNKNRYSIDSLMVRISEI